MLFIKVKVFVQPQKLKPLQYLETKVRAKLVNRAYTKTPMLHHIL